MTKSRLYRVTGVVLGRRNYGEADRVVTLLTPEGRLDLLAKGVRKIRSRKAGHLELFSRTDVLVSRVKGSWDIISQAESGALRPHLQDDFGRGTYARYAAELALRFFPEEANEALYTLVDATLSLLATEEDPGQVIRWYEQQLLVLAGFRPEWHHCVGERERQSCERALHPKPSDERPYGIDPERGGALCPDCFAAASAGGMVGPLSPSALSWLQAFQRRGYAELAGLSLPERTTKELARTLDRYISYHLERRPAALRVFRERASNTS